MNSGPAQTWIDDEVELRLLQRAIDEAMKDAGQGVSNDVVCAEMQQEVNEIEQQIAALMASEG